MGADCSCCRNKRKGCESAVLGKKLLRSVENNNSSRSKSKKPIIRTFNFNSDIVPKNNLKGKELNLTSFYKVNSVKPLKHIHRFEFSELKKNSGLSEGAYKIAAELYGKHWADKLKHEADKFTVLDDALVNLKLPLNLEDIKSVKSTPTKTTLTELQTQVSSVSPKEISFNLKENGDIDEQDINTRIDTLNKRDQEATINDRYVYPYGDEPIFNESEDRAIKDWIHKMMLRFSTDDDKRLNLIMVIAEIIMSVWKTDKSLYRITYGFYLAKDLYKIGVFFKFNHYELIKCINDIIGMDIDWNKFNQEALLLSNEIGFGSLIWKQLKALDMNKDLIYKDIKSETENILLEIDKWSESVKIPLDQI